MSEGVCMCVCQTKAEEMTGEKLCCLETVKRSVSVTLNSTSPELPPCLHKLTYTLTYTLQANTNTSKETQAQAFTPLTILRHWELQCAPSFCHCSDSELLSEYQMFWSYMWCQIQAKQSDAAAISSVFYNVSKHNQMGFMQFLQSFSQ